MNTASMANERKPQQASLVALFDFFLLIGGMLLLTSSFLGAITAGIYDELSIVILGFNGILGLSGLLATSRGGHSLLMMAFYFSYIFFAVAPLQQLSVSYDPIFNLTDLTRESAILCTIYTVEIWLCLLYQKNKKPTRPSANSTQATIPKLRSNYLLLATVAAVVTLALFGVYGAVLFTSREAMAAFYDSLGNRAFELSLRYFFTPLVVVAPCVGMVTARINGSRFWMYIFGVLVVAGLLINNPLVTPRYKESTLIIFIILTYFGWNRSRLLLGIVLMGTLVSPILNNFRTIRGGNDAREFGSFFAHLDYDCLNIVSHTLRYVEQQGIAFGSNIISAFFFFVPRAIWQDKAENITKMMFDYLKIFRAFGTDNLSSPLPAEGYFAFGAFGAIILPLVFFSIMALCERRANEHPIPSIWGFFACLAPMLMMITQRGPLLIGYGEFIGHAIVLIISVTLLRMNIINLAHLPSRRLG